jgi:hypothetical protein
MSVGFCCWNSGANSRRMATSAMAPSPLSLAAADMPRNAARPGSEKQAPQSASTSREARAGWRMAVTRATKPP